MKLLNSSKFTAAQKGVVRSLVVGGYWTASRLWNCGYSIDKRCPLCLEEEDTVHHRLYHCHVVKDIRDSVLEQDLEFLSRARLAGSSHPLYTRLLLEHPDAWWPRPLAEEQAKFMVRDGVLPGGEGCHLRAQIAGRVVH